MCIKWCPDAKPDEKEGNRGRLFTGGLDNYIHAYDMKTMTEDYSTKSNQDVAKEMCEKCKKMQEEVHHCAEILDLLVIPEHKLIASASADSNMCLWDMSTLKGKSIHTNHEKKIYSLDWVENQKLILSAGLDHDIYIWNPIV